MSVHAALALVWLAVAPAESPGADDPPAEDLQTKQSDAAPGSIEDLYYKGAAHYSAADYGKAIERFTEALDLAGRQGTDPSIRAALLFNLARAHTRAHAVDGDTRHLRQAIDIHRRFIEEANLLQLDIPDQIEAAETEIAEIEAKLAELDDAEDAEDGPAPAPVPAPAQDDGGSKRRVRGIALTVSGAVALGAGVGVAVYGTSFRRDALDVVDQVDDPPEVEQKFIDDETRKGRVWIGVGAGVAAVGTGLLIWGIVDLAAAKRDRRAVAAPLLGPGLAGVAFGGRF
jgi:hypothetical protein